MASRFWQRIIGQTFGNTSRARRGGSARERSQRPALELLEDRLAPAVTSTVVGGILTINGTFNDDIFVSSQAGLVKVNGADPNSGAALSSSLLQVVVNPGAGNNQVDLRAMQPAQFTSLLLIDINGGAGVDDYKLNTSFFANVDTGNTPSTVQLDGAATNLTFDVPGLDFIADNRIIDLQNHVGPTISNVQATNFTVNVPGNSTRAISDNDNPFDGLSRTTNVTLGRSLDFRNPSGTLAFRDTSVAGNITFQFEGLDPLGQPTQVVLDANNKADRLNFGGTASNVVADYINDIVHIDELPVAIPNSGPSNIFFGTVMENFTLKPGPNNHRVVRDDGIANNGISRLFNANDGTFTDVRNPTNRLTVLDANAGGSTYEYQGIDSLNRPAQVVLDTNNRADRIVFSGTATNVVANYTNDLVTVDGMVVAIPNSGPSAVLFDGVMTNFTLQPGPGNHRVVQDNGIANDGISRLFNASNGTFTDVRNPSNELRVQDINPAGGSTYEYRAVDAVNRPAAVVLDANNRADLLLFSGTATNVVADYRNDVVTLDGVVVEIPNSGPTNVKFDTTMANFTVLTSEGNHRVVRDDGIGGNGISRLYNADNGSFTDVRHPTGALTVRDANPAGGSTFEFEALDTLNRPASLVLDANNRADQLVFSGTATTVIANYGNDTVNVDGLVVSIPNSGPTNVFFSAAMTNFTLQPSAGNHRVITDDPNPNDGISRLLNADDGTFTDVRNPSGMLRVQDVNGGMTLEFRAIDAFNTPAQVVLDANNLGGQLVFGGNATTVVANYGTDTVTIDGVPVLIPNSGPSNVSFPAQMTNFTLQPGAGNHRVITDNGIAGDGITRLLNADDNSFTDVRNPSAMLRVQDVNGGGMTLEFRAVDSQDTPAKVILDANNLGGQIVFGGTATNVVANYGTDTVTVDGVPVLIPNSGPSNIFFPALMTNFTLQPGAGNHRVVTDDGVANNSISRLLNADDGTFTDVRNPSAMLRVQDVNGGGMTLEYRAVDAANRPAMVVLDANNQGSDIVFGGTATNVIANYITDTVTVDGVAVLIPNSGPSNVFFGAAMTNFTLQPGPNNHRIVTDNGIAGDGISRLLNGNDGTFTDVRNPSAVLRVQDVNAEGGSTYEFRAIDAANRPAQIVLDANNRSDRILFSGTATNVVADYITDTVTVDAVTVLVPNSGPSNVFFDADMTNFTLRPGPNNHRIVRDDPTPNDGISRLLNNNDGTFTDVRNPSNMLRIQDVNAGGGSTYEFRGIDGQKPPARIVLDANGRTDTIVFGGTATNVVANYTNDTVMVDGVVVEIPNSGPSNVFFNAVMTNFTLQPGAGNHRVVTDNGVVNDGISRLLNNDDGTFTDVRNPSGQLTVQDVNATGGSTYEFRGIDGQNVPAQIVLDANNHADQLIIGGTATNVIANYSTDTVTVDGVTVLIPNSGPTNVFFDAVMTNFTLQPGAGNHRILRDDGFANNGISRLFNNSDGTFTDVRNPSGRLVLQDVNDVGGSTYEFQGLDGQNRPGHIVLDTNNRVDRIIFSGTAAIVTANYTNDTVALDGITVEIPNSGPSNVFFDTVMTNFTLQPGLGNHRVLMDDDIDNNGVSRLYNADNASFTDVRHPSNRLTIQDINASGGSTYEFQAIDADAPPAHIVLDAGNNANRVVFNGTYATVLANYINDIVTLDGVSVEIPNSGPSNFFFSAAMESFTLQPGPGNHRVVTDNGVVNDGISRLLNNDDGTFTDVRHPSDTLRIRDANPTGWSTYEYLGMDQTARPDHVILDVNNRNDLLVFRGTYGHVIEDLNNNLVRLDDQVVEIPNSDPANVLIDANMTNFTMILAPGNHRILQDNNIPNDGISRAFNATNSTFSDFRHPTGTLSVLGSGGDTIIENRGLDAVGQPMTVNTNPPATNPAAANPTVQIVNVPVNVPAPQRSEPQVLGGNEQYTVVPGQTLRVKPQRGLLRAGRIMGGTGPLSTLRVRRPRFGRLHLNLDGSFRYTPNAKFRRQDSFSFLIVDAAGTISREVTVFLYRD